MACGEQQRPANAPAFFVMKRFGIVALLIVFATQVLTGTTVVQMPTVAPNRLLLDGACLPNKVVVVGERGTILFSYSDISPNRKWQQVPSPTTATLTGISFTQDFNRGWAVGHEAIILGTINGA